MTNSSNTGAYVKIFYLELALLLVIAAISHFILKMSEYDNGLTIYKISVISVIMLCQFLYFTNRGPLLRGGIKGAVVIGLGIVILLIFWGFEIDLYLLRFSTMKQGVATLLLFSFIMSTLHVLINIVLFTGPKAK